MHFECGSTGFRCVRWVIRVQEGCCYESWKRKDYAGGNDDEPLFRTIKIANLSTSVELYSYFTKSYIFNYRGIL